MASLTEQEADELQDLILTQRSCGAQSFALAGGYEVHPRATLEKPDFPPEVQEWLREHGFIRAVDVQRGPFYRREKERKP